MPIDVRSLPSRTYAHPFDFPVKESSGTHGVEPDSNAIGGYRGIGWYSVFRDGKTGEIFHVRCSDGVDGGKSAHCRTDEAWMQQQYYAITKRTKEEAGRNSQIKLSPQEWAVTLNYIFYGWLDKVEGDNKYATIGDNNRHLTSGQIGTINNIPVIVDPNQQNPMGPPPSQVYSDTHENPDLLDHFEDLVD